jgi:hypothetical protein
VALPSASLEAGAGWPFGLEVLKEHYGKARRFVGLPDHAFDTRVYSAAVSDTAWRFKTEIESRVFHTVGPRHIRLGKHYQKSLLETLTGMKLEVKARAYAIACGGIDNQHNGGIVLRTSVFRAPQCFPGSQSAV